MKIEAGKYYRTRDGRKVGPMIYRNPQPWDLTAWRDAGGKCWHDDGRHFTKMGTPNLDIIAEWREPMDLTAITTPYGLLDAETKAALRAHGGTLEYANTNTDWEFFPLAGRPCWTRGNVYRVKPQPPKTREWFIRVNHNGEIRECAEDAEGATLVREVLP